MSDKYQWMREAWGLEGNPFPPEPIHRDGNPFSENVSPAEYEAFLKKGVYGAVMDRRGFGFLWSKGSTGGDTGFGKTTLLTHSAREINHDLGATVLLDAGMPEGRLKQHRSVAAYSSVDTTNSTGMYPVLFSAVEYLANPVHGRDGKSVLERLRSEICKTHDFDEAEPGTGILIKMKVLETRERIGATLPPLRDDALEAFVNTDVGAFARFLSEVTIASRIRNGLQYFDIAYTIARAAGMEHLFVFVDQLEDLATTPTVTRARRTREVGRLRDIVLEDAHFAGHLHIVLTMHIRASDALLEMWSQNRLPSFDPEAEANQGYIVVLRGLTTSEQVRELLGAYIETVRMPERVEEGDPFTDDALQVLLEQSEGRPGLILRDAHRVLDRAAERERPAIDAAFTTSTLGATVGDETSAPATAPSPTRDARVLDDILQ